MELRPLGRGRLHGGVPRGATTTHHQWAQQTQQSLNNKMVQPLVPVQLLTHKREGTSPRVPSLSPIRPFAPEIKKNSQRKIIQTKLHVPQLTKQM
ncbi:hypothetical protein AN641_01680 [Candidatus Epulonipiscioides gigas]|nr:hypothetical protein AN641_01680 [Epulopiscium sp. SCG-C07WGA-EpuloA2]